VREVARAAAFMNRTGLFVALALALVAGLLFAIFPQLDVTLAHLFYNTRSQTFALSPLGPAQYVRRATMLVAWAFAAPAIVALIAKLIRPDKPLFVPGRATIFLLSTILLIAIVLPDVIFKHHWGRPRPIATIEFNGSQAFRPWWDPRGADWHNTSFFSGEAATAFWTYAPAALAPSPIRPLAFVAATIFGLTTGILRMAFGAHYASDVIAAGVAAFLVTWFAHGFIYRWRISRVTDNEIDQWLGDASSKLRSAESFWWLSAAIAALTIARLVALKLSVVDLFPDEARYWWWSRAPALGYFSKPPLIAWVIAGTTHICGSSEACVRASAPLFYAGTALVGFFIARELYGERVGFWSGLGIALATGIVYSARIISTDVALLFFSAVALLAYVKTIDAPGLVWSVVLGLALGFGLLAKYAMIYFLLGAVTASFIDPAARALWRRPRFWFALAIALSLVAPNLIWNATHNFATFRHTWGNIIGDGLHLNPLGALAFLGAQFGVYGPVAFAAFLLVLAAPSRFQLQRADWIMIAFALTPLALVSVAALFTSAEANWAAPAGLSIIIVTTALLIRQRRWRWLRTSLALGIGLQIVLATGDAFADRISLSFLPKPDVYHRTMGWKALSSLVRQRASATGSRSIAADQTDVVASLRYYLDGDSWAIFSEPDAAKAATQSDRDRPLTTEAAEPILYVSGGCAPERLAQYYSSVETLGPIDAPTGPHSSRRYCVFKLSGARGPIATLTAAPH
jgi:hypothetical protein